MIKEIFVILGYYKVDDRQEASPYHVIVIRNEKKAYKLYNEYKKIYDYVEIKISELK